MTDMRCGAVNHSVGGCVRGMAHTNGMESFRSMRRRGYYGTPGISASSTGNAASTSPRCGKGFANATPSTGWSPSRTGWPASGFAMWS